MSKIIGTTPASVAQKRENLGTDIIAEFKQFTISVLEHKNDKAETSARGYKSLLITSPEHLIETLNTYHCSFATLKGGHREDANIEIQAPVIKLDVDAEGEALKEVSEKLEGYDYVFVPSQSDKDYKAHIIVICDGEADARKAGYQQQVDIFLMDTKIDVKLLDPRPLYSPSGYLAPASCGTSLTVETATAKSYYHSGVKYELTDLDANGIVVKENSNSKRGLLKDLKTVTDGTLNVKDVESKVSILEKDSIIYYYGRKVLVSDVKQAILDVGDTNTVYGGFSCAIANKEHTMDLTSTSYSFAFISTGGENNFGGEVLFKCTGNACSHKNLSMVDSFEDAKPKNRFKTYHTTVKGSPKVCLFDRERDEFFTHSENNDPIFTLAGGAIKLAKFGITTNSESGLPQVLSDATLKSYLSKCDDVMIVVKPFQARGFKPTKDKFTTKIYNNISKPRFKAVPKDATPIVKEALSIFDTDFKIAGYSTFLIILSAQLFGTKPLLASPALVGAPKTAKTFYAYEILKEYWGKELIGLIDPDIAEAGWGDILAGKRHICYNDLDKMSPKQHSKLVGKIKREATEGDEGYHNMKGGSIKSATASNRSMTSNYVDAIPLDAEGQDRRIYIPTIDFESIDADKMARAFDPRIAGVKGATKNRQDLINHLFKLWQEIKSLEGIEKQEIKKALFVEVPTTEEKRQMMSDHLADGKALIHLLDGAKDEDLVSIFEPYVNEPDSEYDEDLDDTPSETIAKLYLAQRVDDGKSKWFIPEALLQEIRTVMRTHKNDYMAATKVEAANAFIGKRRFSTQSVKGVRNLKGVKIKK